MDKELWKKQKQQDRHVRAELRKLHQLAIEADPAALKEKKEREAGLITGLISLPLCAGLIYGAYQYSPKAKAAKANTVTETRVEQTVDVATPAIDEDAEITTANNERVENANTGREM